MSDTNQQNSKTPMAKAVKLSDLLAVYDKYKHLDGIFDLTNQLNPSRIVDDENDPFHIACYDMWNAIKKTLNR